jgi:hypothetical protein
MWSNIKRMIPDRDDIDYGYKDDSFYWSISGITKEALKKNWFLSIIFFFGPLYGAIFGFIVYYNQKDPAALPAACVFAVMLFFGIFLFIRGGRIRIITFFHDHLILSDKYLFGEKKIAEIPRHEIPELIIKKASDTEIPRIKDIELLLPFKGKNHKIVSHRTADDFERIEGIFANYRNGKSIRDLASGMVYSAGKITDDKRYEIHVPVSELNRDIKRVILLFLFHCFCCICGSLLSLPQATLGIARISSLICFLLLFVVVLYGRYIRVKCVGKEKDYSVEFSAMPIWLKSISILSFVWFPITLLLSVDDFIKATLERGWPYISMDEASTQVLLMSFSFIMVFSSIYSADNISQLLKFKASNHKHSDS